MVRADLLDGVDSVLRRYRRSDLPFGGVQLLMIGDLQQLSPVVKDAEWQILHEYYDSPYFFSSTALRRTELIPIELKHIYRQSDPRFIELLNRVRDNRLDPATLEQLNSRHHPGFFTRDEDGYITLCTHNSSADAINAAKLKALPGKSRCFNAEVDGDFPEHAYPTAASLELKIGAQVMFVRNDCLPEKRYFNGKIGKITGMIRRDHRGRLPGGNRRSSRSEPVTWENIEYNVDPETTEISQKMIGTFNQYPLKPAWAITIHKSQGLTFDKAVIDAQAAFAHGQVYVALSRCRTFEGMVLSSPISPRAVKTDPVVLDFIAAIEEQGPTETTLACAKIRYQQQLLLECFDFQPLARLLGRLVGLIRGNASIVQMTAATDLFDVQQQTLEAICTVGDNFRRQLQSLFGADREPAADPVVLERLAKAGSYFQDKFETILKPCVEGLEVESDNKEVRKRIVDAIKLARQECAIKLAAVLVCRDGFSPSRYLRALSTAAMEAQQTTTKSSSIYTEADVGHPELFRELRQWRNDKAKDAGIAPFQVLHQKTLIQIAVFLPDSLAALKAIKGIGKRLAEKYGPEIVAMVAGYRIENGIEAVILPNPTAIGPTGEPKKAGKKEDTKTLSREMLASGLSIPEIAQQRGLTTQTVEGHLAFFVKTGELAIDGLLPADRLRELEERITNIQARSIKDLKIALGDDFSYGEINLMLAHLEHRNNQ